MSQNKLDSLYFQYFFSIILLIKILFQSKDSVWNFAQDGIFYLTNILFSIFKIRVKIWSTGSSDGSLTRDRTFDCIVRAIGSILIIYSNLWERKKDWLKYDHF